jgi:S-adenosylmethionine-diacylgycerolhomoserine-N-methlytransferase
MSETARLMDRMYRRQRHVYDLSRKYYLVGRDEAIARVGAAPGHAVLEIGCGTGRNLIKAAKAYPLARFFGLDVSREMLETAAASIARAGLSSRIVIAEGDATDFDPSALFGQPRFNRVIVSYALSMIPAWREALGRALDVVGPDGELHCVDFGDCSGLPRPFRSGLRRWLAAFDVSPRDDLAETLAALAGARGFSTSAEPWRGGYATLAVARRGG